MTSPFATVALEYLERGYSILPIVPRQKYPGTYQLGRWQPLKWSDLVNRQLTKEEFKVYSSWPEAGIGLALGEFSGVIALDFDELNEDIQRMAPQSPCKKVGRKGYTAFYRYNGETNRKWHPYCELLSTGNQTVLPPSFHKDTGQPYYWVDGQRLCDFSPEDLPTLPADFAQKMDAYMGKSKPAPTWEHEDTDPNEVEQALNCINPDCGYGDWVAVGMALKLEFGDAGFHMWDAWSRKGSKYPKKGEQPTRGKWNSFQRQDGVTIATVYHLAKLGGWRSERARVEPKVQNSVDLSELNTLKWRIRACYDLAPNLVGDVARWITSTAIYPQPILSLAASIALCGAIMGHKTQSHTRARTNMLTMGVAPSGAGKEHPRQAVDALLRHSGQQNLMGGDAASSAGLLKSLKEGHGRRLMQLDEFGRVLKQLTGKNVAAHQAGITTIIMRLFSSASGIYYGQEYANADGNRQREDIIQPHLCIHASTVPGHLYEAMTGSDAIDGFLSRWLIFETDDFPLDAQECLPIDEPPAGLIERLKYWKDKSIGADIFPNPDTCQMTAEALERSKAFQRAMRERVAEGGDNAPIYARTYEHAIKLALVAQRDSMIDLEAWAWAEMTALYCSDYLVDAVRRHVSSSKVEADTKFVLRLLESGPLSQNELTRRTQKLSRRERQDIIGTLIDSGEVEVIKEKAEGEGKRPRTMYRKTD
jgi:hypothetical protein